MGWGDSAEAFSATGGRGGATDSDEASTCQRFSLTILAQLCAPSPENARAIGDRVQLKHPVGAALPGVQCRCRAVAAKHEAIRTGGSGMTFELP